MSGLPPFVLLNGRIVPAARARISVFDRGLLYGDGLFETVRTYAGQPFALDDHLARLRKSAKQLGLRVPQRDWAGDIERHLRRCRLTSTDAAVRITLTRGAGAPGLIPPPKLEPTVLMVATPIAASIERDQSRGIRVALLPFGRVAFLAEHKTLDYLPAVLGRMYAQKHGACEGLYVERGCVSEATTANLFVVRGSRLLTPPVSGLLPGVTRKLTLEAAAMAGVEVRESVIRANALPRSSEMFITSSLIEVMPVIQVDGIPIGNGNVGALTRRIQVRYRQIIDQALSLRDSR
ncbi:MAG: aminotransferase class IV [Deltaproteobacteria bacterium]|nr:aminotransferase class IV [Deltaproteobacteria bacterium]